MANGIRIAVVFLAQYIPSHIVMAGHRILISHEEQPTTCYGINDVVWWQRVPKKQICKLFIHEGKM